MAKTGILGSILGTLGKVNADPMAAFRGNTPGVTPDLAINAGMGAPGILNSVPQQMQDNWKPHTPTLLGALADAYLMSRGGKPAFAENRDQANIQEAMQGMADNPQRAINRMSQIRGHGGDAWKMLNEEQDNMRQQGNLDRQNKLYDLKLEEIVRDRIAGMAGAATPETWGAVRQRMDTYARAKGFPDIADGLPQDYNKVDLDTIRYGEVPVARQEGLERTDRRLDQADTRLTETGRHNQATEGLTGKRIDETGRHNQVTEGQAGERITQSGERITETGRHNRTVEAGKPAKPRVENTPFMTKYGPMVRSKDGMKGFIRLHGKTYGYVRINDQFVPIGEISVK
jgi:hypothetical protein